MKLLMIAVFITALGATATTVAAQENRNLNDERNRIHQGVKSGELTANEAARLHKQKKMLKVEARQYKSSNGRINRNERADLKRDNALLNRNIHRQKHDRQKRF